MRHAPIPFALVAFLLAAPLAAQTPINPTAVAFDHADYAGSDGYVLGYFTTATSVAPVQEAPLPKPAAPCPCPGALVSRPSTFAIWHVALRATAGTLTSAWSNRVPFERSPVAPVITALK